jgi:predicted kinase
MQEIKNAKQKGSIAAVLKLIRMVARIHQPVLVVLCVPSHAGKTTFTRRLGRRFTVVSSEEIRKELVGCFEPAECEAKVWEVFEAMKKQALKQGNDIVLDACHMSKKARRHSLEGSNNSHRKVCVVFDLPLRAVRKRCLRERRLPLMEAERMWKAFQGEKPKIRSLKRLGFDEVYFLRK